MVSVPVPAVLKTLAVDAMEPPVFILLFDLIKISPVAELVKLALKVTTPPYKAMPPATLSGVDMVIFPVFVLLPSLKPDIPLASWSKKNHALSTS